MSVTAAAIVLGALVVLLIKTRAVRALGATICIVFGVTLAAHRSGPSSAPSSRMPARGPTRS